MAADPEASFPPAFIVVMTIIIFIFNTEAVRPTTFNVIDVIAGCRHGVHGQGG